MEKTELLNSYRTYFQRAQLSWDNYFKVWEKRAQEEDVSCIEDYEEPCRQSETESYKPQTKITSAARKLRKRAIMTMLNRKKDRISSSNTKTKSNREKKRVSSQICCRKRGAEIIHTTKNQTNSECQVVNNKHFEADLKAIFIETLSRYANRTGIFSVLSKMSSGNDNTMNNYSASSMIIEKSDFSVNADSKTMLHSSIDIKFLNQDFCSHTRYLNKTFRNSQQITNSFVYPNSRIDFCHSNTRDPCNISRNIFRSSSFSDNFRSGLCDYGSDCSKDDIKASNHVKNTTLSANISASPVRNISKLLENGRKCFSESCPRKRKRRTKGVLYESDSGSDDDNSETPRRSLKIFCTPQTSRRSNVREKSDSPSKDSDDDHCTSIFDRVRSKKV